jgi:hypothetical protein
MGIMRVFHTNRPLFAAALIGVLACAGGCGSGTEGESTVAPPTPPPGRSAADRKAAMEQAQATSGTPGKTAPRKAER